MIRKSRKRKELLTLVADLSFLSLVVCITALKQF